MDEEEIFKVSLPELRELENKVGRKTPEGLLIWLRDAADSDDEVWSSDVDQRGDQRGHQRSALEDSLSDKINNLKQEMKWLRSADVRILRQLVAVHEGIEAMRWLMEEREALISRGSSLTGSLSSQGTVEDRVTSLSPCSRSLTHTQDWTETTGEELKDHPPNSDHCDSNHRSDVDMVSLGSAEARTPSPPPPNSEITYSTHELPHPVTSSPVSRLLNDGLAETPEGESDEAPSQHTKPRGDTIRRALSRSSRSRRGDMWDTGIFYLNKESEETPQKPEESLKAFQTDPVEESLNNRDSLLLGYDAQWFWVESQDDVTLL